MIGKNIPRKVRLGCLGVVVLSFAVVSGWVWHVMGGEVKVTTDYAAEINALVESHQRATSEADNAWSDLLAVVNQSEAIHREVSQGRIGKFADRVPDPAILRYADGVPVQLNSVESEEIEAAKQLIERLATEGVFAKLRAVSSRHKVVRPLKFSDGMLIEVQMPELAYCRKLASANATRYHLAVLSGKFEEATEAFETGLGFGRMFMQQGSMMDRLVGQLIMSMHLSVMIDTVTDISEFKLLQELLNAIERQSKYPEITLTLETERRKILDVIQRTFSDVGDQNGYLIPDRVMQMEFMQDTGAPPGWTFFGFLSVDRKETTRTLNSFFDKEIQHAALPRKTRAANRFDDPIVEIENQSNRYFVLKILIPSLWKFKIANDQMKMELAGARTVLGVEMWARTHGGTPPAKLDNLVPKIFAQLPQDPMTSESFGYRILTDVAPEDGRRYLVYSYGSDGVDNRGVQDSGPNRGSKSRYKAISDVQAKPGFDFVINHREVRGD